MGFLLEYRISLCCTSKCIVLIILTKLPGQTRFSLVLSCLDKWFWMQGGWIVIIL